MITCPDRVDSKAWDYLTHFHYPAWLPRTVLVATAAFDSFRRRAEGAHRRGHAAEERGLAPRRGTAEKITVWATRHIVQPRRR